MMETIVAIATAQGPGAIGIVRLSGPAASDIGQSIFHASRPGFSSFVPWRLHHGQIRDAQGVFVDEALAAWMPGPASFTGEDVLELQCHGGAALLRRVLELCLERGARLARAGEFSKRAFLNGRLDLTQAEAIAELIAAPTAVAAAMAGAKLEGALGGLVGDLRTRLEKLRVQLCVAVDFPEEEIECLSPQVLAEGISAARSTMLELAARYDRARCWREGALVVLAGQVNAGKSSLMNAILGMERAIVADLPGTTRDYLEEAVQLDGLPVRLVDTAGLRPSADSVEWIGIERSRALISQADLILLVMDAELGPGAEDLDLASTADSLLVVANKMDLLGENPAWFAEVPWSGLEICQVSARHGQGMAGLLSAIRSRVAGSAAPEPGLVVPNLRQCTALRAAAAELDAMLKELAAHLPYDVLSVHLDMACAELNEITGQISSEDVLQAVFADFCIGK